MADCVLGCGENRIVITGRCGAPQICDLTSSRITWGRVMDETSQVDTVVTVKGGALGESCCECVGGLRTWIHSGTVYRNGDLVWGPGPVTNILYKLDTVLMTIKDISAWLDVRIIHNDHTFVNTPVLDVVRALIEDALSLDDPCNLLNKITYIQPATPTLISRQYLAATKQYAGDALRELAQTVVDYTVVGDRMIIGERLSFGPYTTLTDEDFLAELEVEERGAEAASKWYVKGAALSGEAGGIDPYAGLIERVATVENVTDQTQLNKGAANRLDASNPAPVYINIPDGAQLSPKAEICPEQLVPGTLIDVVVRETCRPVTGQMRLTAVKFEQIGSDEAVGVTLSPVGTNFFEGTPPAAGS